MIDQDVPVGLESQNFFLHLSDVTVQALGLVARPRVPGLFGEQGCMRNGAVQISRAGLGYALTLEAPLGHRALSVIHTAADALGGHLGSVVKVVCQEQEG